MAPVFRRISPFRNRSCICGRRMYCVDGLPMADVSQGEQWSTIGFSIPHRCWLWPRFPLASTQCRSVLHVQPRICSRMGVAHIRKSSSVRSHMGRSSTLCGCFFVGTVAVRAMAWEASVAFSLTPQNRTTGVTSPFHSLAEGVGGFQRDTTAVMALPSMVTTTPNGAVKQSWQLRGRGGVKETT